MLDSCKINISIIIYHFNKFKKKIISLLLNKCTHNKKLLSNILVTIVVSILRYVSYRIQKVSYCKCS